MNLDIILPKYRKIVIASVIVGVCYWGFQFSSTAKAPLPKTRVSDEKIVVSLVATGAKEKVKDAVATALANSNAAMNKVEAPVVAKPLPVAVKAPAFVQTPVLISPAEAPKVEEPSAENLLVIKKATRADLANDMKKLKGADFVELVFEWGHKYGHGVLEPLAEISSDLKVSEDHRYMALVAAVDIAGEASLPLVKASLEDPCSFVRRAAVLSLVSLGKPSDVELVYPLLKDKAMIVREASVRALARFSPKDVAARLYEVIASTDNFVKDNPLSPVKVAVESLVALEDPQVVSTVCALPSRSIASISVAVPEFKKNCTHSK